MSHEVLNRIRARLPGAGVSYREIFAFAMADSGAGA
jgi:hypothetical protein